MPAQVFAHPQEDAMMIIIAIETFCNTTLRNAIFPLHIQFLPSLARQALDYSLWYVGEVEPRSIRFDKNE